MKRRSATGQATAIRPAQKENLQVSVARQSSLEGLSAIQYNCAMPRRFQFSLKMLLAATALWAVGLFVWQAYPFASIQIRPPVLGQGIEFHGRLVEALRAGKFALWYELERCEAGVQRRSVDFGDITAHPSGLGLYRFQGVSFPIDEPGEYRLQILRFDSRPADKPSFRVTDLIAIHFSVSP